MRAPRRLLGAAAAALALFGLPEGSTALVGSAHLAARRVTSHRAGGHRCSARRRRHARSHAHRSSFHQGRIHHRRRPRCVRHGTGRKHHRSSRQGHRPAAHSSACLGADLTPNESDLERVRGATLCLINRERTGHGEHALQPDARMQQAAQRHSEDMANGDYFEHVGPGGDTPQSRMRASGYIAGPHVEFEIGENIAWGTLWLATPRSIVSEWMNSPDHRANILDGHFRDTAIGVSPHPLASLAEGQAGAIYTQDFGVIVAG